jgi:hypothetical protein
MNAGSFMIGYLVGLGIATVMVNAIWWVMTK